MYSALAGFIEPGESIEEAVARELKKEAGIEIY
jgi:NTP pyrophosphohydrolases containing a Zn-finger, probably nucleic-acid-binding